MTAEQLVLEPYASIICYPRGTKAKLERRVRELRRLGVNTVEFSGSKWVSNIPVVGKGCVGMVVVAYRKGEKVALKIRRTDADRPTMLHEARLLRKANSAGVGPVLLAASRNFLLMQFIDGRLLLDWLQEGRSKMLVRRVLRGVLEQCWHLDMLGLDHGELSHAPKHILIDQKDEPFIVDFETASLERRPSNVTSICQFLFISGRVAERVKKTLGLKNRHAIIRVLRRYKEEKKRGNFEALLKICELQTI